MAKHVMEMVLEYARVFAENADMGNAESDQKWLRELAKNGGQTVVNCYFTSEDQIDAIVEAGFERMALNPRTNEPVDRIKEGNPDFGIGKYLTLKRKLSDVREFKDKKTGEFINYDFGGLPKVVDLRDMNNKRFWSFAEDGPLGNGTRAMVEFDMYKGTTMRLEAVGILDHVAYEERVSSGSGMFDVKEDAA